MPHSTTTVTLSDGEPCEVRRLGLFELDIIQPPDTAVFVITVNLGGREYEQEYDISLFDEPPARPEDPEADKYGYLEHTRYQAAVLHVRRQREDMVRYLTDITNYILTNCLRSPDKNRIVTAADMLAVRQAALVPQLSREALDHAVNSTFRATYGELPLLDALYNDPDDTSGRSDGKYNSLRVWEIQAMTALGKTEAEWSELPLAERARFVVANKIDGWISSLDAVKSLQERHGQ